MFPRRAFTHEIKLFEELSKPLQKNAGVNIGINRYYTDVNGTILVKTDPAIPQALKVKMPFWLFGEFDRKGGYRVANERNPAPDGVFYVQTFVVGIDTPFLFATGLNTVQRNFRLGDVVHVFTDNIDTPTAYCFIQQSSSSCSLASIYANSAVVDKAHRLNVKGANYFPYTAGEPNFQFAQNMTSLRLDETGLYKSIPIDPLSARQTTDKQDFIFFPIDVEIDQYNLLTSYIDFAIDNIEFAFLIKKNTDKV